jgi:hypothetical protein
MLTEFSFCDASSEKRDYYCIDYDELLVQVINFKSKSTRSNFRHYAKNVERNELEFVKASRTILIKGSQRSFFYGKIDIVTL